jgi:hypothetical protein
MSSRDHRQNEQWLENFTPEEENGCPVLPHPNDTNSYPWREAVSEYRSLYGRLPEHPMDDPEFQRCLFHNQLIYFNEVIGVHVWINPETQVIDETISNEVLNRQILYHMTYIDLYNEFDDILTRTNSHHRYLINYVANDKMHYNVVKLYRIFLSRHGLNIN